MTRPSTLPRSGHHTPTKTVLVLGASYGGHRAIQQLVTMLPSDWKLLVLERNSHFNHLYAFPRMSIISGHEHKIFVPYSKVFQPIDVNVTATDNRIIHGNLVSLAHAEGQDGKAALGRGIARYKALNVEGLDRGQRIKEVHFDYLLYALGSHLPPPINLWSTTKQIDTVTTIAQVAQPSANQIEEAYSGPPQTKGTKKAGIKWLQETQERIRDAESVLIIGAGALGVQYAGDIANVYGTATSAGRWTGHASPPKPKKVTLLSSSPRILPRFQSWMHEEAVRSLSILGVEVITGERADLNTLKDTANGTRRKVKTLHGREIEADIVLFCTGQKPNTEYLRSFGNVLDTKTGMAIVTRHLQLAARDLTGGNEQDLNHIFVVGDAADAFGALNAGHAAREQAELAARNIVRLITEEEGRTDMNERLRLPLEEYTPCPRKIKVSVGLDRALIENDGTHKIRDDIKEDLNAPNLWLQRGLDVSDMTV